MIKHQHVFTSIGDVGHFNLVKTLKISEVTMHVLLVYSGTSLFVGTYLTVLIKEMFLFQGYSSSAVHLG